VNRPRRSRRLLVRFERDADPSLAETLHAREAIARAPGARVLDELPGTIQVEVAEDAARDLLARVAELPDWSVVEEGVVEMPDVPGPRASRKRTR
jgi:hypothetical protein